MAHCRRRSPHSSTSIRQAIRTGYRHKEHGFVVDPGGDWLNQSLDAVLNDLASVPVFRLLVFPQDNANDVIVQ